MSAARMGLSVLAIGGMLNAAVLAQSADGQSSSAQKPADASSSQTKQQSESQQQKGQAPEGWVLIEERVVVLTANEPQNHFLRAQQHLAQGNAKAAAAEASVGAAYLEMQAARAKGTADHKLTDAAMELRQKASQISQAGGDAQKQQEQLKEVFASANAALASHFKSLAQHSLQRQRNVMAGYDLNAAADSLAAAFAWSDKQPQPETLSAIGDAQQVAAQLMMPGTTGHQPQARQPEDQAQTASSRIDQEGGQAPANVSQAIDKLGNAIQQSSSSFQSAAKQAEKGQSGSSGQ